MTSHSKDDCVDLNTDGNVLVSNIHLASSRSNQRLNQIDQLRAFGLSNHINLPQLVVCGKQSAGKSSVLEGITGIPFPREDGLCTRFGTEIILRHQLDANSITATILADSDRSVSEREQLSRYQRSLSSFAELPKVIKEVATLLGVRGYGDDVCASPFASDVLRLEVVGDTGLHLTVVDLPGLIPGADNADDASTVEQLVFKYMKNPRTIILAVISAANDVETEAIIRDAKHYDKAGMRTIGIVTKTDMINKGTEHRVAALSKDRNKLKLGFFLLRNPDPTQLSEGMALKDRVRMEQSFFTSDEWKDQSMDKSRLGIDNLRNYMQDLLSKHIERELPKVRTEVKLLLDKTNSDLNSIGPQRSSVEQMRIYMIQISMRFYDICRAALNGGYDGQESEFFKLDAAGKGNRLRSTIHVENTAFSTYMRDHGAARKLRAVDSEENDGADSLHDVEEVEHDDELKVSSTEMNQWIRTIYQATRGRELPGSYSHALITELYHQQSSRWPTIAREHIETIEHHVYRFTKATLKHVITDADVCCNMQAYMDGEMEKTSKAAEMELSRLIDDERGHPITYNHYLTDTIQKARQQKTNEQVSNSVQAYSKQIGRLHISNTAWEHDNLVRGLQHNIEVDMDKQGCAEAFETLKAYYKVARKTFVDNVCRQVVERHILRALTEILSPVSVSKFSDEQLEKLVRETSSVREKREELTELKKCLERSLKELRE